MDDRDYWCLWRTKCMREVMTPDPSGVVERVAASSCSWEVVQVLQTTLGGVL